MTIYATILIAADEVNGLTTPAYPGVEVSATPILVCAALGAIAMVFRLARWVRQRREGRTHGRHPTASTSRPGLDA